MFMSRCLHVTSFGRFSAVPGFVQDAKRATESESARQHSDGSSGFSPAGETLRAKANAHSQAWGVAGLVS